MLPDITKYFTPEIIATFAEIQQSRSEFQLEKFVINAHDTNEMRYYQCILEIQQLYYTIKQVSLELKKTEIEIQRLRATGDDIDEIDAQIKELGIEQTKVVGVGAFRELEILLKLKDTFPAYTREEIEKAQPDYWNKRLTRQAKFEAIGGTQAQAAHLTALHQIGAVTLEEVQNELESSKKELK
jgi:hypothetical protein